MTFTGIMNLISLYAIPVMILGIVLTGVIKKVKVYEVFCDCLLYTSDAADD